MVQKHRLYDSFGNLLSETNRGDLNGDGRLDIADVDALVGLIVGGQYGEFEDLNRDGVIDNAKTS